MTESISGSLEISSAKEMNLILFNLTSGRFLGQEQKSAIFFAKISQDWSLTQLLILHLYETSWVLKVCLHSLSTTVFQVPNRSAHKDSSSIAFLVQSPLIFYILPKNNTARTFAAMANSWYPFHFYCCDETAHPMQLILWEQKCV